MMRSRRGQTWAVDLGISLVVFTLAVIVTYAMLENTLEETAYADVREQALDASDLLLSEGSPRAWTNETVLRVGVLSDGVLSLRKARELALLSDSTRDRAIRSTDRISIVFENASGAIEPFAGVCGIGDLTISGATGNRTLPAIAIARTPHPIADAVSATIFEDDTVYALLDNADVLLIEGNLSDDTSLTPVQVSRIMDDATRRGITVIIIGDPGIPMLGMNLIYDGTMGFSVSGNASAFALPFGAAIDLPGAAPILLPTLEEPNSSSVTEYQVLATTDGASTAIATWIYGDARVWYLSTSDGTLANGTALSDIAQGGIEHLITVDWPACGTPIIPDDATQIARYDRAIAHHDQLLTLRVIAWRDR